MKKNIHPKYQKVLFIDSSTGHKFVCGCAIQSKETDTFEGVEYPVCRVSISSSSHPFFTGSKQLVDSEGRVDKFKKRYAAKPVTEKTDEEVQSVQPKEQKATKAAPKKKEKK